MGDVNPVTSKPEEAKVELESVLASALFTRSPRLANLLRYLCTKTLGGEAEQIKEYSIAVEVLGRPAAFDPSEDAIARVEVHRLRKKLREFYQAEGAEHRLRIVISPGNYVPLFVPCEPGDAGPDGVSGHPPADGAAAAPAEIPAIDPPGPARPETRNWRWPALAAAAALIAAIGFVMMSARPRPSAPRLNAAPALILPASLSNAPSSPFLAGNEVRIACGQRKPYTDRAGNVWNADAFFEGGIYFERQPQFLGRTADANMFQNARVGDFSYRIPLRPGTYELRLYFVETSYGPGTAGGGGETSRVFHVSANARRILNEFDVISDAGGPDIADVRVFKDISGGADGLLHLRFMSQRGQAMVSAIELVPAAPGRANPVRISMRDASYTDSAGRIWAPDNYWSGGQVAAHTPPRQGTPDPALYARERFGNFSYAIPVDDGVYAVSLHLAELYWGPENPGGGGAGSRVFDVFCNGAALARNLDVYREAGGNRALIKSFPGLTPNAQGKLALSFVPVRNYASVYAIEVTDETPGPGGGH